MGAKGGAKRQETERRNGLAARKPAPNEENMDEINEPIARERRTRPGGEPLLLTVKEVADLLRTTAKAIYAMAERGQIGGITRIGRRLLFRRDALLDWLCQKSSAIAEGVKR